MKRKVAVRAALGLFEKAGFDRSGHGATAGGAGDPPGFRLDDCATHSGTVSEATEQRAKTYARESLEDIWAGYDAMLQHRGLVIGSPAWCRYMGVLWFNS